MKPSLINKVISLSLYFFIVILPGCASIAKTIKDNPKSFNSYNPDGTLKAGKITFVYIPSPTEKVESVSVGGDFNNWSTQAFERTEDGNFILKIDLAPGKYRYMYIINNDWIHYYGSEEDYKEHFIPEPQEFYHDWDDIKVIIYVE
ncbi:MAG: hypothetical protein HPY53_11280 [Brevinematales bacterium]|nr:hypothetical protein [Brevinematales bacterium]